MLKVLLIVYQLSTIEKCHIETWREMFLCQFLPLSLKTYERRRYRMLSNWIFRSDLIDIWAVIVAIGILLTEM